MTEFKAADSINKSDIAIIGMAGQFPGAKNITEFWQNLKDGVESISWFSREELLSEGVEASLLDEPNYVKASPLLSDVEQFDASFFGYSAREAQLTDPQQRIFLECAWSALENAGYKPETDDYSIGIYGGLGTSTYLLNNINNHQGFNPGHLWDSVEGIPVGIGNGVDFLTTRVAYKFNLKGPAINVQTACSTGLVVVHTACQSLLNGECDIALAGAVSVLVPQKRGYLYQDGLMLSPDGHCRAFDAKAKGTLFGDGVGVVVLKMLEDALADDDHIYAVIKGSAINNDGRLKVSFTAPSVDGQAAVITEAQAVADIDPETITYIEAHGTGTPLGDPIEIAALTQAFRANTEKKGYCAIGSVKTNIGHLVSAAGIASLIKAVLALKHQQIPPSLHFEKPNPEIDFANSPFYVNTKLSEWEINGTPRRAGVSSFGFGGTNAHVVLEEWNPPLTSSNQQQKKQQLLLLSAKTPTALETATVNLANHLKQQPQLNLGDVAHTLTVGRIAFDYRRVAVVSDREDVVKILSHLEPKRVLSNSGNVKPRSVVFMFSGQGSQYVNMARDLYETEAYFQAQVDRCCTLLIPHLGFDLRDILYPRKDQIEIATEKLKQTAITQPSLFVIEYSLAKLWMYWGIKPVAMIGHSIGEYVAATLAGVFSLEDALRLVTARGKLMQSMPSGSMLAIPLPEAEVKLLLKGTSLEIATINSPTNCVVSGSTEAIEAFEKELATKEIEGRPLHASHAFHSSMMDVILKPFTENVKQVKLHPPTIPFVSNLTGTWITVEEATNPNYYAQHLRSCVRFADGVKQFFDHPNSILLEVGPGRTLSTLAKRHPDKPSEQITLTSIRHPQEEESDIAFLLTALGQLWLAGTEVDWDNYYGEEKYNRVPLPTYPFERQRYWIDPPKKQIIEQKIDVIPVVKKESFKKSDIADWFYVPSWKQLPLVSGKPSNISPKSSILIFVDELGLGSQLIKQLETQTQEIISVKVGEKFAQLETYLYSINPNNADDYQTLIQTLQVQKLIPQTIIHLWNVTLEQETELTLESVETAQNLGFYSLLYLTQTLGTQNIDHEIEMVVVSNHLQNVTGEETIAPEKATIIGPVRVIPQEYNHIHCRMVDIVLPPSGSQAKAKVINQLLNELQRKSENKIIAYRGNFRWVKTFEPVRLEQSSVETLPFKQGGVYLITGGMGGIGLVFAEYLAKTVQAKLVLTRRSAFPERHEWEKWLTNHSEEDPTSSKIRKVQQWEESGAKVLVVSADVANQQQMAEAISLAQNQFGQINGVIHAAGVPGGGVIQWKTREIAERVLAPKVQGTTILEILLKEVPLDFMVVCSSNESLWGNFGQIDYCGANNFLDAYAHSKSADSDRLTISINWDSWQEVGMAVKAALAGSALITSLDEGILPQEGVEALNRILDNGISQILVSTQDLQYVIDQTGFLTQNQSTKSSLVELSERLELSQADDAPQSQMEKTIVQIWQEVLGIKNIGVNDNLFNLGGDSLAAVQVIAKLNKKLNVKISVNSLLNSPTIKGLAELVSPSSQTQQKELPSCLIKLRNGSDQKKPLFLVHPVGGTAFVFQDLANNLDSAQPVYGIQVPEVDSKPQIFNTIEAMATHYIEAISTVQPKGPYHIGGMSLGGMIAYEMAQQLTKQGEEIGLLTLFDTAISNKLPTNINSDLEIMAYWLDSDKESNERISLKILQNLEPNEQLRYFWQRSRIAKSMVLKDDVTMFRNFLDLFISMLRLGNKYAPSPYQGKVLFFVAQENDGFNRHHPEKDWLEFAEIVTEEIPGNHMTMMHHPQVDVLAQKLQKYLEQA